MSHPHAVVEVGERRQTHPGAYLLVDTLRKAVLLAEKVLEVHEGSEGDPCGWAHRPGTEPVHGRSGTETAGPYCVR